ncbi:MAG TPA: CAP domain-containing protein [Actinomycetes bacterium]
MSRSRLGTVVLALAIALLGSLVAVPSAQAAPGDTMVASVNASRRAAGLAPYAVRADLVAVALGQAQRMAASNRLYHNPNLATDVKNYAWAGENVGYGPDLVTLHQAFMNSPAHRANILSARFTEIGIAVVAKDGVLWVAEVFRRPWSAGSTASTAAKTTTKTTTTTTAPRPAATKTAASKAAAAPVRSATPSPQPVAATPTQPPVVPTAASTAPKPTAAPPAPAPAPKRDITCAATPQVATSIQQLIDEEHTVRQVEQLQRLVTGFQCGSGLATSGVLDQDTLTALAKTAA